MTTWEVQKPYPHAQHGRPLPETVDRYTAVIDDKAIGRFDTSDEAHEAIIQELVKRLDQYEQIIQFRNLKQELADDGYRPYYNDMDAEIASGTPCQCGKIPTYHGMRHENGSYRAFAVCAACGHWEEF